MGLSIHYSGSLKSPELLPALIAEVKDIVEIYKWKFHIFDEAFPAEGFFKQGFSQNIYGICFTPPGCETVKLCFLSNGRMSGPASLQLYGAATTQPESDYLYMLSVKTQYAGIEIHKLIIHLFKYLSHKYLQGFTIVDEGKYWETGNEQRLQAIFKRYNDLVDGFASSLEHYPIEPGETFEAYFKRLMEKMQGE